MKVSDVDRNDSKYVKSTKGYVPPGAGINMGNGYMNPPSVIYEKRRASFSRDEVKDKITKRETP